MLRRLSFLPTFFIVLAIAFGAAVALRIHSLSSEPEPAAPAAAAPSDTLAARSGSVDVQPEVTSVATTAEVTGTDDYARRAAERERRYRELLSSPPPPSLKPAVPPPPPVPKPSLLSRITAPIVNAFGGGERRHPPGAGGRGPRTGGTAGGGSQQGGSQAQNGNGSTKTTTGGHDTTDTSDTDPNSDTTPPRLVGATFDPAVIEDGATTMLTVTASDDLSGVRTVAGNILSPGGALQGFSAQRAGDSDRFIARVSVPKNSAEGMWHVNFLSMTDGASNTVTLTWRMGQIPQSAQFKVNSASSDTTAPTLRSAWLDKRSVRAGEKATLFVDADDDRSGVSLINGVFVSPSKFARLAFNCRGGESGPWQCDVLPQQGADCGQWQLEQIQIQDKANNLLVARQDNQVIAQVQLDVSSDRCDSQPPSVDVITLDTTSVTAPGTLNVTIQAHDDSSGVSSIGGHFFYTGQLASGTQPPRVYFSCHAIGADGVTWTGPVAIGAKNARGVWKLGSLQVMDKAGNMKIYNETEAPVAGVSFRVQ